MTNIGNIVTAAIGAILISTAFVTAAVGPAHTVGQGAPQTAAVQLSGQATA